MQHKVYGTFTKRNGFIYRTETFIKIGESDDIIGSCILCNPGSASLHDPLKQKKLENHKGNDDYVVDGEIMKEDATIRQLIEILKGAGLYEGGGRFLIHNLFTLRNSRMPDALIQMQDPGIDSNLLYKDYDDYINLPKDIPWTIIGWGCDKNSTLKSKKKEWLQYMSEKGAVNVGYKHKDNPHYYHPLPPIHSKKEEYVDIMVNQLKSRLAKVTE